MREIHEGETASFAKTITEGDVALFAEATGDVNPLHLDADYARTTRFGKPIAHGMLTASLISTALGTKLPGAGTIYLSQSLRFLKPVYLGDTVTATVRVQQYDRERGRLTMATVCANQHGEDVVTGEARILYQG
ncbi:MAG: MaoC family dehydratase [Chloroflexota bacterium]